MQTLPHPMVAFDRRARMHALVRPYATARLHDPEQAVPTTVTNTLLLARRPKALLDAASSCGRLRDPNTYAKDVRDALTLEARDLSGLIEAHIICEADPDTLIGECLLDPVWLPWEDGTPVFPRTRRPITDARCAASQRRLTRPDASHDVTYLIEPLQDWLLLRNLASVVARIASLAGAEDALVCGRGMLERAGFAPARSALGPVSAREGWAIPVAVSPDGDGRASGLALPLLDGICTRRTEGDGTWEATLATDAGVSFVAVPAASAPLPRCLTARSYVFMVVTGPSERDAATSLLDALTRTFHRIRAAFSPAQAVIAHAYEDAPSAFWATLIDADHLHFVTCRQCGRTMLSRTWGRRRRFCGDVCRSLYGKRLQRPYVRRADAEGADPARVERTTAEA